MTSPSQAAVQPFDFAQDVIHTKQRGLWSQDWHRLLHNKLAVISGFILLVICVLCVLGEYVPAVQRHDPTIQDYAHIEEGPSAQFWLGTDSLGRDLWARMLQATLFSLKIGLGTQLVILLIGVSVGMGAALA